MTVSLFELFKIGIGPSSSHTVGPMRAARKFLEALHADGTLDKAARIEVRLYGSLALTGHGHGSDTAILLGLAGERPDGIDPDAVPGILGAIRKNRSVALLGRHTVAFAEKTDLIFEMGEMLPHHTNGMRFAAFDEGGAEIWSHEYYSVGGGFIVSADEIESDGAAASSAADPVPYNFASADELLTMGRMHKLSIAEIMMENEKSRSSEAEVRRHILEIWHVMDDCIDRGCNITGNLPGKLNVRRRARDLKRSLMQLRQRNAAPPNEVMDWISIFAIAVNEQNAAGGRIVTAPTNGAAGVVPAVLRYYVEFCPDADEDGIVVFLLAAAAVGALVKRNASISGAEMGCQGEVGTACAMAAAGLAEALGGTNEQVENAAEIGMEHHLGMTCDPIGGLVQIPCIERNAMGAVKAINAASLALKGDGFHYVSLDNVIETMRQTGLDMQSKYKETSQGGLAVNVPEC